MRNVFAAIGATQPTALEQVDEENGGGAGGVTVIPDGGTFNVTDRASVRIKTNTTYILKVDAMPGKSTLNNADNSATAAVGTLADGLFLSGAGTWTKLTGLPL